MLRKLHAVHAPSLVLSGALLFHTNAHAADSPPPLASGPAVPAATTTAPKTTTEAKLPPPSTTVWKDALTLYSLADYDSALTLLRTEVVRCGDVSEGRCSKEDIAILYASTGVVLSGGKKDHDGGVNAFKKGLSLDPRIELMPEYQTAPVLTAFHEAKTGARPTPPAPAAPAPTTVESNTEPPPAPEQAKQRTILLIAGSVKTGAISAYDSYFDISGDVAQVSGSAVLGGMPGTSSGFTMGGRLRGGGYFGDNQGLGYLGFSAVLGSTIGPRRNNKFAYFLGGFGSEYYPSLETGAATASFQGGASLGGFLLGGAVDFSVGNRVAAATIGIELGWGGLL